MGETSVTRTLALASRSVGGAERLASCLGVTQARLQEWLEGHGEPPVDIYLRALDLVAKGPFAF